MGTQSTFIKNGTSQKERLPEALRDNYLQLDPRTWEDMLQQTALFAKNLIYYNCNNEEAGDWKPFFEEIYEYYDNGNGGKLKIEELKQQMKEGTVPPHIALILSFLKLFQIQQKNFNSLLERHLLFYYQDVLGFSPQKGDLGKATVFIEAKKNVSEVYLPKGTEFDAGKDKDGKPIRYISIDETIINQAKVNSLAVSYCNGECKPLSNLKDSMTNIMPLEFDNYGFILSSQAFEIKENTFQIKIKSDNVNLKQFKISYTGRYGMVEIPENKIENTCFTIENNQIICYDKKIHGNNFNTQYPVFIFTVKERKNLNNNTIDLQDLTITVKNSTDVVINNSYGKFPNETGTMPFGPICEIGASFSVEKANGKITKINSVQFNPNIKITDTNNKYTLGIIDYDQQQKNIKLAEQIIKFSHDYPESGGSINFPNPTQPITLAEPISVTYELEIKQSDYEVKLFCPWGLCENTDLSFPQLQKMNEDDLADSQDSLLIGLTDISTPSIVSLYFHINPFKNETNQNLIPQWYIFEEGKNGEGKDTAAWKSMNQNRIVKDSTNGLKKSGVIRFQISEEALSPHISMPNSSLWLKVSFMANSDKNYDFDAIEDIRSQALEVMYDEDSIGVVIPGNPLPANSITKLVKSCPGIKKAEQPYDGETGTPDETMEKFKCRVSEKLRHKGKAWTSWDYERLVLERFPQIAHVKCICNLNEKKETEGGNVLLLVIPDQQLIKQENPLKPIVGEEIKSEIKEYLKKRISTFVSINIASPTYVEITISAKIKLKKGYDDYNYYFSIINERLKKYLAPWSDNSVNANFNQIKNESDITAFLDGLDCVDNVDFEGINYDKNNTKDCVIYTSAKTHNIKRISENG